MISKNPKMKNEVLIMDRKIYQLDDRTMKYKTMAQTKRQHQYLGLPGEFKIRLPQEIIFPNLENGRVDELYSTNNNLVINIEEESGYITEKTLEKFAKYAIFTSYRYFKKKLYILVLCHKNPKSEHEYYKFSPSLIIKIHYIHFSQATLWQKFENIINKVKQKEKLSDMEALDIAFLSKFISKKHAPIMVEKLAKIFKETIIEDFLLKMDIGVILAGMILKNINDYEKQNKLLGMIDMAHFETEIQKIVYDEFGEELGKKDKEITKKNKEITKKDKEITKKDEKIGDLENTNNEYKNKLKQLNEIKDLNTPEAKKIIESMLLL